jgi:hypothetical protein
MKCYSASIFVAFSGAFHRKLRDELFCFVSFCFDPACIRKRPYNERSIICVPCQVEQEISQIKVRRVWLIKVWKEAVNAEHWVETVMDHADGCVDCKTEFRAVKKFTNIACVNWNRSKIFDGFVIRVLCGINFCIKVIIDLHQSIMNNVESQHEADWIVFVSERVYRDVNCFFEVELKLFNDRHHSSVGKNQHSYEDKKAGCKKRDSELVSPVMVKLDLEFCQLKQVEFKW